MSAEVGNSLSHSSVSVNRMWLAYARHDFMHSIELIPFYVYGQVPPPTHSC